MNIYSYLRDILNVVCLKCSLLVVHFSESLAQKSLAKKLSELCHLITWGLPEEGSMFHWGVRLVDGMVWMYPRETHDGAIMCQNWARIRLMLQASAWFWPRSGMFTTWMDSACRESGVMEGEWFWHQWCWSFLVMHYCIGKCHFETQFKSIYPENVLVVYEKTHY